MLRQAGIAKGMAIDPLCVIEKKNIGIIEEIFINNHSKNC